MSNRKQIRTNEIKGAIKRPISDKSIPTAEVLEVCQEIKEDLGIRIEALKNDIERQGRQL